uniref:intermembrane phospholipid transport protein YdbH family protein n=1 Tax=uncultured Erythrobacter sp. TaxID=263913 RepID=UPI00261AF45C|nr:YdbH domain-containing protein [uncultured Erythrobacter sp.]
MASAADHSDSMPRKRLALPRKRRWRALLLVLALLATAIVIAWMSRERIAGNIIETELERLELPATYEIVSITPQKQLLRNLVVGDPAKPDLFIEEVTVDLEFGWAGPVLGEIEVVKPRLYGTYLDGKLSFGALDPVIFAESDEPAALPALDIAIRDGRALLESDFGAVAAKLNGEGMLEDGFVGELAITAPGVGTDGCSARTATAFGDLNTDNGVASFNGPVRFSAISCEGVTLTSADATADLSLTDDFSALGGSIALAAERLSYEESSSARIAGDVDLSWSESGLNLRHDITANDIAAPYLSVRELRADGAIRSDVDFARSDWDADVTGGGISASRDLGAMLDTAKSGAEGTMLAALLEKFDRNFTIAAANADLTANVTVRQNEDALTVLVPEGRVTSANGDALMALSRVSWTSANAGGRLSGNFVTGGAGLPRINGRMEQGTGGALSLRMAMAEYAEGQDRIAIPRLQVEQSRSGDFSFNGALTAAGVLPGGNVSGLEVPVEGAWSAANGLTLGRRCSEVRFRTLSLYQLALDGRSLAICPAADGAMVRYDDTLSIDVATRDIELEGLLADSPTRLSAGAASVAYPGNFVLSDVVAVIGAEGSSLSLKTDALAGGFEELGGVFTGAEAQLDFVPLDLSGLAGRWSYTDEALVVEDSTFILTERTDGEARFEPLIAQDATLRLAGNDIAARASLLNPGSGRLIARVDVKHNLGSGEGGAAIDVPGVVLDDQLRPEDLSYLPKGVIAFADGIVSGEGSVAWIGDTITSEGTFGTQGLDLAATFGPIDGLRGTVEFTDLINLSTAPSQVIEIGSINPGIEVLGGRVVYSMTNGELIAVSDARWPFMGGELILQPVDIRYGTPGEQLYVFEIVALDAATFIAQMELTNLGATGTFDGSVPILFDDEGNGTIGRGLLISRPPGGNVSYIGELTYEDMGAITNFAFQSLRSLDYKQMSIGLDGSLAGEIVTSFKIDGVRQGDTASKNLVTRQLAKLPIRFNVNVRSQNFYQLATMVRSFFDPEYLGNPVDKGLLSVDGGRFAPNSPFAESQPDQSPPDTETPPANEIRRDDESPVQPSESDDTP